MHATVPSSTRPPHAATFTTASRNDLQSSPRSTREDPGSSWALSSEAGVPANSFSKVSANVERRPESAAPFGANPYGSPLNVHIRVPNTQIAAANAARNLYAHPPSLATSQVAHDNVGSSTVHSSGTLSPPISTIPNRRSPSPLHQFETAAAAASRTMQPTQEFTRRNAGPPELHQGMVIDSSSDYYSRHNGPVAAIPPQPSALPVNSLAPLQATPAPSTAIEIPMCAVCFEEGTQVRFAARSPTAMCQHGATVCVSCLEQHILIAIHKSRTVDIRCPHAGCGKMLEYQDIYCSVRDWSMLA